MKKNVIVGQSGGPTAVINASLYGVVNEALNRKDSFGAVFGMINGIEGFAEGRVMDMEELKRSGELELVKTTPGSYLGSCRYKLPKDLNDEVYPKLFERFKEYDIGYFFYIGGNDSMDTVSKLSRYAEMVGSDICFLGIPKTIDNDLVNTDHTPGFGSAAKYVASTVREIAVDASVYDNKKSVTIVEIMGRHAGWLTAASALARKFEGDNPVLIYLPEVAFDTERFIQDVSASLEKVSNVIVCISEGINDGKGTFICIILKSAKDYEQVIAKLNAFPEVVEAYYTTGNYSIFIKVMTHTIEELHQVLAGKIQSIDEIQSTETLISMQNPILRDIQP